MNEPSPAWADIVPALTTFTPRHFPAEAVAVAESHWEEVAPHLMTALEAVAADPEPAREGDYMLHFYAMFLLAQHRVHRAFAPMLRFTALPEEVLEDVLSDVVTEGLGRCLASTCAGEADREALRATALDDGLYLYARSAALQALMTLVMENTLAPDAHREWLIACGETEAERLRAGRGGDPIFLALVVADLADTGAGPALGTIRGWYTEGLVDTMYVGLDEVERDALRSFAEMKAHAWHVHYVRSVADEMAAWHCFKPESEDEDMDWAEDDPPYHEPYRRETPKIGRNDPCPCGSGKKYKKCCGAG
jgi:hypothetical protein